MNPYKPPKTAEITPFWQGFEQGFEIGVAIVWNCCWIWFGYLVARWILGI